MAEEIARRARELGYRTLVLDTLGTMEAAQGLYVSMGFKPATSYYVNPLPNVKYFSLDLRKPLRSTADTWNRRSRSTTNRRRISRCRSICAATPRSRGGSSPILPSCFSRSCCFLARG